MYKIMDKIFVFFQEVICKQALFLNSRMYVYVRFESSNIYIEQWEETLIRGAVYDKQMHLYCHYCKSLRNEEVVTILR